MTQAKPVNAKESEQHGIQKNAEKILPIVPKQFIFCLKYTNQKLFNFCPKCVKLQITHIQIHTSHRVVS
jgi:hypothetical protein